MYARDISCFDNEEDSTVKYVSGLS